MVSTLSQIQLAGSQGIFHADMAHGDAVAHADGRDQNGRAARHADTGFDGVGQLIQVHVAGHDLAVGADDADQRAFEFLRRVAQRIEQAAVGRALGAFFDIIAAQNITPFILRVKSAELRVKMWWTAAYGGSKFIIAPQARTLSKL